jgi:hypothetical protein
LGALETIVTSSNAFSAHPAFPKIPKSNKKGRGRQTRIYDMPDTGNAVFLQIQNSKKPEQIISVVMSDSDAHFETKGLKGLFDLDEIRIDRNEFLVSIEEYATLLSFLFETMSEAQELKLPYSYMENFEYNGQRYSLIRHNNHRMLKKADQL